MKGQHENGYQQEMNGNVTMDDNGKNHQESCPACTNEAISGGGGQFITRFIQIPLIQESLSNTQSMASQYKLGRFLLDHTHSMVRRLNDAVHKTKETSTYRHYFRQDSLLQRSLVNMDAWACSSLDVVEARVPLIQQSTNNIVHTLIVQPRQHITTTLGATWESVVRLPLSKVNVKINQDLDGVEQWMMDKDLVPMVNGTEAGDMKFGGSVPRRVRFLGGSAVFTMVGVGKERATYAKQQCMEWTKQQVTDFFARPLLSDKVIPMAKSLQSRLDVSLSKWTQWMRLTAKQESAH